jgi:two-component system, OmpR family, sensor kinase
MARSLRTRLTLWMLLATVVSLVVFAAISYTVLVVEEGDEMEAGRPDTPEEVAADAREQVFFAMLFAAPIGLGMCVLGAIWASRRAFAPIVRVTQTANEITIQRLDRRVDAPAADDEARHLAEALNGLLGRLERGYRELAMFASDASHELRTPIAAVCTELEVALRRPRSAEEWVSSAQSALRELRRLGKITDALLRFAQADASDGRDAETIEVADWLADVVDAHAAAAREAGVTIDVRIDPERTRVRGDLAMLSTAAGNILSNALRYAPRGSAIIVEATARAGRVAIAIEDQGPGLGAHDPEVIFRPFARGSHASDRDGIGLGLPIAVRIVERHDGTITAANRASGGARFTIELPADP